MSRAPVPAMEDILCESCGYTLNGLPESGRCPECGEPIGLSRGDDGRELAAFERTPSWKSFKATTGQVLAHPERFYRTLTTRADTLPAWNFAFIHRWIAALLFSAAAVGHFAWVLRVLGRDLNSMTMVIVMVPFFAPLAFLLLAMTTWLATLLSSAEARFWGMRLPRPVVGRAMQFHSACYLPVGMLAVAIVFGYQLLLHLSWVTAISGTMYLYTLCAAVLVCAGYLFRMYWIAMKNIRYANR